MPFSSLTAAQQTAINNLLLIACPMMAQLDRDVANAQVVALATTADVTAGLAALQSTDQIPNPTNLAGAGNPTVAQVNELLTDLATVVAAYGILEKRQLRATFAGAANLVSH